MSHLSRRDCIRLGAAGLFGLGLSPLTRAGTLLRRTPGGPRTAQDKLLVVFLRGGCDGVYAVAPQGDPTYPAARGSLYVPPSGCVPLQGTSFAMLNKNLEKLANGPQSPDQRGHLALVMQCGNAIDPDRSHFNQMDCYEGAISSSSSSLKPEGWLTRLGELGGFFPDLRGASVSNAIQTAFRSTLNSRRMVHLRSIEAYDLGREDGSISPNFESLVKANMALHLTQNPDGATAANLDGTAELMLASESIIGTLQGYPHSADFPLDATEAQQAGLPAYPPGFAFAHACEDALQILLNTDCRVAGVEFGGWDTHVGMAETRALIDPWLAQLLRALYDHTADPEVADHVTIMVISEFGRTDNVNGQDGLDHGAGGILMLLGRKVNGGVYNMHGGSGLGAVWPDMGAAPSDPKFVNAQEVATDFRTVYAELLEKRFQMTPAEIDVIVPGWAGLAGSTPAFATLGLFA